jgi:MATE family multidrug resistance protein
MLVNTILILINVYHNKRSEHQLIGMGLGTVFSNIIGYLLISSLNIGLACEIARAREKKKDRIVGIYYQRALVVDFIACILIITPLLYISNKILAWNELSDNKVIEAIGKYLFQLVPSIYAFTFFDTTRVYLQSQYIRSPPMLILLVSLFFHYFIADLLVARSDMESMGAAWAKNFTDICCAIAIYVYIVRSEVVKTTWIEWNMQCLTNWRRHLKLFIIIGFTSYLEALMFLLFIVLGSSLTHFDLAAHISLANWTQIFLMIFLGLKQGLLTQLYELIAKNMWK